MLSKCANPGCSNRFLYLHQGKVFLFDAESMADSVFLPELKKPARRLEHFWLCKDCASKMTLAFRPGVGIITKPVRLAAAAKASSS